MKYTKPEPGEWVQPVRRGYKLRCCDCGLVHRMDFRLRSGRIQFRAWRDERATGAVRRGKILLMASKTVIRRARKALIKAGVLG